MSLQSPPCPTYSQVVGFEQQEGPQQEDRQQHPHQSQEEKHNPHQYQQELQRTPHQHQQEQRSPHDPQQEKHEHPYQNQQEQQPNRHECRQKQQDSTPPDQQEEQEHGHQNQQDQRRTHQHEQEEQQHHPYQCTQEHQRRTHQHEQEEQQHHPYQCTQEHQNSEHEQEQLQENLHHRQPKQERSLHQDQQGQQQHPHLDQQEQHQQFTSQHGQQHHDYQHQQQHPHRSHHTPQHPHHYYHTPQHPHQNEQHHHHDLHTPQLLYSNLQHQYPHVQQQQKQHPKRGLMCLYPEVRAAIAPNMHSVTKQMHLISPSVQLRGTFPSSPGNVQLSQNQQRMQTSAIHESVIAQHVYPPPLASHGEVVADKDLFLRTLTKFHAALGTKLSIPRIGGKDLDLHILYKEVTARGGLEMVIKDRKWKEITLVFNFPPTTTSASFVLRKYYFYLLHQYEKVYFFQHKGPVVTSAVPLLALCPDNHSLSESECMLSPSESPEVKLKKQKIDSAQALGVDPASSIGSVVTGCIDGKFEHGYLVNVTVGTRKMRGVLYHVPPSSTVLQSATVSPFMNSLGNELTTTARDHQIERRQKKKLMTRKDPNAPRQNRTGYNFFFAEQRARLKSTQPDKNRAISKMIGDLWNSLSEDEKLPYQERGMKEKERYRREMCEYKEKLRLEAQGATVGTGSPPSGLQTGIKSDLESDIDLNKVETMEVQ